MKFPRGFDRIRRKCPARQTHRIIDYARFVGLRIKGHISPPSPNCHNSSTGMTSNNTLHLIALPHHIYQTSSHKDRTLNKEVEDAIMQALE